MQKKIVIFINGYRGSEVIKYLKKKITIDKIIHQKEIYKQKKILLKNIKKKIVDNNYLFIFLGINKIINKEILNYPKYGCFNCHAGTLPKYRGASPIVYQILNNEKFGTCYILRMTSGIDDGPFIYKKKYKIDQTDNSSTISEKVNIIFSELLLKFINNFKKGKKIIEKKQNTKSILYWTKRYPRDSRIDWKTNSSRQIVQLIKSQNFPYPGAFNSIKNSKRNIIFLNAKIGPKNIKGIPGRIVRLAKKNFTVLTVDGSVEILNLKEMTIEEAIKEKIIYYGCDLI